MNIEIIDWIDSGKMWATWHSLDSVAALAEMWTGLNSTTGYTVYEDDEVVVIAQTQDHESSNVAGIFLIYKPTIKQRKVIRYG